MSICLDIIADEKAWVVRSKSAEFGRYRSQTQAFNAAVREARRIFENGQSCQVRVLHGQRATPGHFLCLM